MFRPFLGETGVVQPVNITIIGAKAVKFEAWLAEIQETVTFVIEPDEWRKYYDAKLSPLDAIAQHVADEEV